MRGGSVLHPTDSEISGPPLAMATFLKCDNKTPQHTAGTGTPVPWTWDIEVLAVGWGFKGED